MQASKLRLDRVRADGDGKRTVSGSKICKKTNGTNARTMLVVSPQRVPAASLQNGVLSTSDDHFIDTLLNLNYYFTRLVYVETE